MYMIGEILQTMAESVCACACEREGESESVSRIDCGSKHATKRYLDTH